MTMSYHALMGVKLFTWNKHKNIKLKKERNVTFEEVEMAIAEGKLIAKLENKSPKYSKQGIFVVMLNDYVHAVPFEENDDYYFLKTIFPSRKLNQKYGGK